MGKKTKSKQRLDTYYHYARNQGYRSRAAYKLIQLNRKYSFLNNSTILIDLCAAPGGWMQIAKEFMPINSTVIGVDLDPIKMIPGTKSFIGDITTSTCYERLKKQIKGQKCDVVLNDGAPNVGANWSKDAYSQSQLTLSALKLACSFLKEGGTFVTKVFRSTDFQSLMWVTKKFFDKVQATKPKASRFISAEIFVVCCGFLAPAYIDEKFFDGEYVFKDTEADHFHQQMVGQITSVDKLLQNRRKRDGYDANAPAHLFKTTTLSNFINCDNALLIFAEYNQIKVSEEEKEKYYSLMSKIPEDIDYLLKDLKLLGKAQIGKLIKWRGKIKQVIHKEKVKINNQKKKQENSKEQNNEDQMDQLEQQILNKKKKQIREYRQKEQKQKQLMIKAKAASQLHQNDQDLGGNLENIFNEKMEDLDYEESSEQDEDSVNKKVIAYDEDEMEHNLQEMYEEKKKKKQQKKQHARDIRNEKKQKKETRMKIKETKLHSRLIEQQQPIINGQIPQEQDFEQGKFKNPLADEYDDIYLSENQESDQQIGQIDPNEKMEGELQDDAYGVPKQMSLMEKRRKQIKKQEKKKRKKLQKDIAQGEDTGGVIEIVKSKKMQDYNIDSLAQTRVIAKKMLRNRSRENIIDNSYSRYTFEDHDQLPKWFVDDELKHNFKKIPITKEEFKSQKDKIMAINARIPKKILEAKVRKKIRIQKKLKKTQKRAEEIMGQQGINEINKLREVGKIYDKSKKQLKGQKKYIKSKKGKTSTGKDNRNIKHVDRRLKKDKRSMKIKKSRHVHRKHKRKGKF